MLLYVVGRRGWRISLNKKISRQATIKFRECHKSGTPHRESRGGFLAEKMPWHREHVDIPPTLLSRQLLKTGSPCTKSARRNLAASWVFDNKIWWSVGAETVVPLQDHIDLDKTNVIHSRVLACSRTAFLYMCGETAGFALNRRT